MRKYKKGEKITTFEELSKQPFVYWRGKIIHEGWWKSWQFRYVEWQLKNGLMYKVENNTESEGADR